MVKHILFLLLATCTLATGAYSKDDNWSFSPFYTQEGLPFLEVRDLLEHPDGSLWVGTWGGGVTRVHNTQWLQIDESKGLPGNWTYCLSLDQSGDVWVGTADGLARIRGEHVIVYTSDTVPEFPNNAIRSIASRQDGTLWLTFSNTNRMVQCNPQDTPTWTVLSGTEDLPTIKNQLFVDSEGTVWLSSVQGDAFHYSGGRYPDGHWKKLEKKLQVIAQAADGLVCGTYGNQIHYLHDGQWKTDPLPAGEYATCMTPGIGDGILIGTQRSLFRWIPDRLSEIAISESQYCRSVLFQRESELIYLGTRYGVQRATRPVWRRYTRNDSGIALRPETLCFDQQSRPLCIDEKGSVTTFDDGQWEELFQINAPDFKPNKCCATANSLWVLCPEFIFEISLRKGEIRRKLPCPSKAIRSASNPAILFATSNDTVWCVYEDGIYEITPNGYKQIDAKRTSRYAAPREVAEHPDGSFYICYRDLENGVGTVEHYDGTQFTSLDSQFPVLQDWDFEAVTCMRNGDVWFGTHGGGVFVYDGSTVKQFTIKDGLYSDLVSRIFEDSDGTVWVAYRENGVGSFRDGLWLNYGTESGLPRWIIDHMGQDSEGRLWVSKQAPQWDIENVHGLFRYNPDRDPPDTQITAYPREGVSSHGIGVFSFTGRDAWGQTPKSKLVYSWRVIPEETDESEIVWSEYSANTSILTDMPPLSGGSHRFEVRSLDLSRNVDATPASVTIHVARPLWQRAAVMIPIGILFFVTGIAVWTSIRNHQTALAEARQRLQSHEETEDLRQQLFQAQKLEVVGTFAAGLAHDINNALSAITCFSEAAKIIQAEQPAITHLLEGIDQATEQAAGITRSLLTFSRQAGAKKVPTLLSDVASASQPIVAQVLGKSIPLTLDLSGAKDIWVNVEPTQIHQVILNIAMNARDAMPNGGKFTITTEMRFNDDDQRFAAILMKDTGSGMPPSTQSRIFEPFFTTKPREKGTGLGMSIVHGIIQDHDGQVSVESSSSEGTCFAILLPICSARDDGSAAQPQEDLPTSERGSLLLVDDNKPFRETLASSLEMSGFQVQVAADGVAGIQCYLSGSHTDVAIVDLDMPRLDGFGCAKQLRSIDPNLPIVFISGGDRLTRVVGIFANSIALEKPFSTRQLIGVIRKLQVEIDSSLQKG